MELSSKYNPQETESKWLKFWKDNNVFHAKAGSGKKPFTIMIPPPNVTGILHMGHALNNTLQDIMVRYKRMNGFETLWMPGTDHAGIATQNVVEKQLAKEKKTRHDLGREAFLKRLWAWKQEYGDTIINQLEKLGSSCDWARTRFTMDDDYSAAVNEAFVSLYNKDLICRDKRLINWCVRCQTALSDEEAEHEEKIGKLYYIYYPFKDKSLSFPNVFMGNPEWEFLTTNEECPLTSGRSLQGIIVATTRPETMLGDTAVAVNPKDGRYAKLIGETLELPLIGRPIKIIADDFVSMEFGTGAVKVTPAHDFNDFAIGKRHKLEFINILHPDGRLNDNAGKLFSGMSINRQLWLDHPFARDEVVKKLRSLGFLAGMKDHKNTVGHCYRCDTIVEPYLSKQWFVKMKLLAKPALEAVKKGEIKIYPAYWTKVYNNWMEDIHDWCISRQIWWGHRIPVWYDKEGNSFVAKSEQEAKAQAKAKHGKQVDLKQDEDVLDTWFSSWLWPFATLGWPKKNADLKYFYPTNALMTASEILFFWVARMIMAGYEFMGDKPFSDVLIHGTVRDAKGRKMSKSLGNAIDPLDIINEYGADALRCSLIINSGQDIFISKEKFEIGRNFANKIWNASRLVLANCHSVNICHSVDICHSERSEESLEILTDLDLPSRWIIAKYYETLEKLNAAIEGLRYSEAEYCIYEFFWECFCDWYLEFEKPKFSNENVQKTSLFILKNSLKIMHPIIPFVTEEVYSKMDTKDVCLALAAWPKKNETLIDDSASKDMQMLIDVIGAIRKLRIYLNIKPHVQVTCMIFPSTDRETQLLRQNSLDIERLANARLDKNHIYMSNEPIKMAIFGWVQLIKVHIVYTGLIDVETERKRISAEITQKQKSIDGKRSRLSNEAFVNKAPQEVIASEKELLDLLIKEVSALESVLANLS